MGIVNRLDIKQPSVLIVAAKWWPLSARLAAALSQNGCRIAALCPVGHPLCHVDGIETKFTYGGVDSLASVRRALRDWRPDVVVPCDDGVVEQLHALHRSDAELRTLIEQSLGAPESYRVVRSRERLLALAKSLGVRVPETRSVTNPDDLSIWHRDVSSTGVLKVDGASGGNGVAICLSLEESLAAWRRWTQRRSWLTAWKRLVIDGDPLSLWQQRNGAKPQISMQEFVTGRPANSMMLCRNGEVLALVSVIVVAAESVVGAAVIVRVVCDERMAFAAQRLAENLRLSGFFGLDFMIDASGAPILIELNPRCTQLGHFELPGQGSLAALFAAALRGEPAVPPVSPVRPIQEETVAMFPQALAAGEACSPYIALAHHDLPSDQPRLYRELQLPSWPRRQWLSRLYHHFVHVDRSAPVFFEAPATVIDNHRDRVDCAERVRALSM